MQGLVKLAAFTAPALVLVVALSFYLQREHKAEMDVETAAFERDWNESMSGFEKSDEGRAKYEKRAALAHSNWSSARVELEQRKRDVDRAGRDLSEGLSAIDQQLGEKGASVNFERLYLAAGAVFLCASVPAMAADISHDTGQDKRQGRDRSMSIKHSKDERDSATKRQSRTTSQGGETTRSSTDRESANMGRGGGLDLTISARDLFGSDGLKYRLPADFGLSSRNGRTVNATYQEWLGGMAKNNAPISEATDEKPLLDYYREVAKAGAALGQALIFLQEDVSRFGGVKRTKTALEISSIGAEDLLLLAKGSLIRAQQGITDARISARLQEILADIDRNPCVFAGEPTNIKCGQAMLSLTVPPRLSFRGSEWYGSKYAGADAQYKISANWSYSKALENAHGNSSYGRWATEQSEATEQMASEGRGFDAVQTRRAAVEKIKGNKAGMSPGRLLPGIQ